MIQVSRFFHHMHLVTSDLFFFDRGHIAMLVDHLILHDLNYSLPPILFLQRPSHRFLPHHYLPDVLVDRVDKLAHVDSDAASKYRK